MDLCSRRSVNGYFFKRTLESRNFAYYSQYISNKIVTDRIFNVTLIYRLFFKSSSYSIVFLPFKKIQVRQISENYEESVVNVYS